MFSLTVCLLRSSVILSIRILAYTMALNVQVQEYLILRIIEKPNRMNLTDRRYRLLFARFLNLLKMFPITMRMLNIMRPLFRIGIPNPTMHQHTIIIQT